MRFVSQNPGYKFQARPQRQRALGDGGIEVTQEPIYCQFQAVHSGGMIYENEVSQAIKHFSFRGNTQDQGEAVPTDPTMRLSVFDTEEDADMQALSAEDRAMVEQKLLQLCEQFPDECLAVTSKPIAAPFPTYDTWDGVNEEVLVVKLIEDGYDLDEVLYYERVFGPKREKIIAALEEAIEARREETVIA